MPSVGICRVPSKKANLLYRFCHPELMIFSYFLFIRFDAAIVILTAANSISAVTESVGGVGVELGSVQDFSRSRQLLPSIGAAKDPFASYVFCEYSGQMRMCQDVQMGGDRLPVRCTRASQGAAHCSYWSLHEPYRPAVLNFSCRKDEIY